MKPGPPIWKGAAAGAVVGIGLGLLLPGTRVTSGIIGGAITGALVLGVTRLI